MGIKEGMSFWEVDIEADSRRVGGSWLHQEGRGSRVGFVGTPVGAPVQGNEFSLEKLRAGLTPPQGPSLLKLLESVISAAPYTLAWLWLFLFLGVQPDSHRLRIPEAKGGSAPSPPAPLRLLCSCALNQPFLLSGWVTGPFRRLCQKQRVLKTSDSTPKLQTQSLALLALGQVEKGGLDGPGSSP